MCFISIDKGFIQLMEITEEKEEKQDIWMKREKMYKKMRQIPKRKKRDSGGQGRRKYGKRIKRKWEG